MSLALISLPVVQAWSWGRADLGSLWKFAAGFAGIVAIFWLAGIGPFDIPLLAGVGLALAVWLIGGAALEIWRRAKTWRRLPCQRGSGDDAAHAGLGLFVMGAVLETGRTHTTIALQEGQATSAGWQLTLDDVQSVEGPNWCRAGCPQRGVVARLRKCCHTSGSIQRPRCQPRKPRYKTGLADLYVALGEGRRNQQGETRWTFEVFLNPFIDLIYLGTIFIGLGALLSMFGRRSKTQKAET